MKRTSPYYELKWVVECKRPALKPGMPRWWEQIAAFNSDRIAIDYARDCRRAKTQHGFEYRVMERRGRKWLEITRACL